jgi:hypothetical protein
MRRVRQLYHSALQKTQQFWEILLMAQIGGEGKHAILPDEYNFVEGQFGGY